MPSSTPTVSTPRLSSATASRSLPLNVNLTTNHPPTVATSSPPAALPSVPAHRTHSMNLRPRARQVQSVRLRPARPTKPLPSPRHPPSVTHTPTVPTPLPSPPNDVHDTDNTRPPKRAKVSPPGQGEPIQRYVKGNARRSVKAQEERSDIRTERRFLRFLEFADHVYLDVSLEDIKKESAKTSAKKKLDRFCAEQLGPNQPAIALSTVYYDSNRVPIFAYFAQHHYNRKGQHNLTVDNQYEGRTTADVASWGPRTVFSDDGMVLSPSDPAASIPAPIVPPHVERSVPEDHDLNTPALPLGYKKSLQLAAQERAKKHNGIVLDGLFPEVCRDYHVAVQDLCVNATPHAPTGGKIDMRHGNARSTIQLTKPIIARPPLKTPAETARVEPDALPLVDPANPDMRSKDDPFIMDDSIYATGSTVFEEPCGTHHFVHGWTPTGHAHKGQLYLSRGCTCTSSTLTGMIPFYILTDQVAVTLGCMLHTIWPEFYTKYDTAFKAGRYFENDPGPFIGRALVYKVQVKLHKDKNDAGPTACFPVGMWDQTRDGGCLLVPQLGAKFAYGPGHVVIFNASDILHKVVEWTASPGQEGDRVSPGRIGSVFFFPKTSLELLSDKPAGWARTTNYGRSAHLMTQQTIKHFGSLSNTARSLPRASGSKTGSKRRRT